MGTPPELAVEFGPDAAPSVDVRVAAGTVSWTVTVEGPALLAGMVLAEAGTVTKTVSVDAEDAADALAPTELCTTLAGTVTKTVAVDDGVGTGYMKGGSEEVAAEGAAPPSVLVSVVAGTTTTVVCVDGLC